MRDWSGLVPIVLYSSYVHGGIWRYFCSTSRLAENFKRATMQHQQEVQDLHLEGQMKVDEVTDMVAEKEHSNEYLAHLERLHMQV